MKFGKAKSNRVIKINYMYTSVGESPSPLQGNSIVVPGNASMSYGSKSSLGGADKSLTIKSAAASAVPITFSAMQMYVP